MIYKSGQEWLEATEKRVLLFGMSGLGKTHVSNLLRDAGTWFHFSIDYRIGTGYMGEHIADNAKRHAMQIPFLRDLLMTDSIFIGSNITFNNLKPLSAYLGKPGDPAKGGLPFEEYMIRQEQHRLAEIYSLMDTPRFARRAIDLYGYPNFVCDSGGSICEVVDPWDPEDELLNVLEDTALMVWIKGDDAHTEELVRRFDRAPKPMYSRSRVSARRLGRIPGRDRRGRGRGRPGRLRALDICPCPGPSATALRGHGAPRRDRAGRRSGLRQKRRGFRSLDRRRA